MMKSTKPEGFLARFFMAFPFAREYLYLTSDVKAIAKTKRLIQF